MNSKLNSRLAEIGVRLAEASSGLKRRRADIEEALLEAAARARGDGRLLSLLFSWVDVHASHVIVDRLRKKLRADADSAARLVISALAVHAVSRGNHKWRKLILTPKQPTLLSSSRAAESAVELKGCEPAFAEHNILVAKGSLRIRPADVLTVEELAHVHRQYRNRLLYGASWRADIITAIQEGAKTAAEVSRRVGCSYEPAHRVRREYLIATSG